MNNLEQKQLSQLIRDNDVADVTEAIRRRRHGPKLKAEIAALYDLVEKSKDEGNSVDDHDPERVCFFLFSNYTDIFNKVKKGVIDRTMLELFIDKLITIEEGECGQHEAAVEIGKLLKKIYIDSALKNADTLHEGSTTQTKKPLAISYAAFKKGIRHR